MRQSRGISGPFKQCNFELFAITFSDQTLLFILLSFGAAFVNGGLGYGYSSISIPIVTLFVALATANPAYVLVELILNLVMLVFVGKKRIQATFRRALPIIIALLPGVVIGTLILGFFTKTIQTSVGNEVKFFAYVALLPLILLAVAGFRRPIKGELKAGIPLGVGTGLLYSLTTISGPPIALFWNNQGLSKDEFKAAIAQIRVAESGFTFLLYFFISGYYSGSNAGAVFSLFTTIAPSVLIGIPIGMIVIRKLSIETFRRVAMNFDAIIVSFGISQILIKFGVSESLSYAFWFVVIAIDLALFVRYMRNRKSVAEVSTFPVGSQEMTPAKDTQIKAWFRNRIRSLRG